MKTKVLLSALLMLIGTVCLAQKKEYINHFEVRQNIAQPVKVKSNLGTFTFSGSYTIKGKITHIEAFDAYGNKIKDVKPKRKSIKNDNRLPNEYWYVFKEVNVVHDAPPTHEVVPVPVPVPVPSHSSYYGYYDPMDELKYDAAVAGIIGIAAVYVGGALSNWDKGTNRLDLDFGYWSRCDGFGLGLAYRTPSVFGIAAGVGFATNNHNIFRTDYAGRDYAYKTDSKRWYVAGQIWVMNGWNFEVGLSNRYFSDYSKVMNAISFSSNAEIHIAGPVAFYGGLGCVMPADGMNDVYFIWNAGLRIRLSTF